MSPDSWGTRSVTQNSVRQMDPLKKASSKPCGMHPHARTDPKQTRPAPLSTQQSPMKSQLMLAAHVGEHQRHRGIE